MENKQISFNDLINSEKPVLVDFAAEWCGPCKAMNPILLKLSKELGDRVEIITLDVDQNPAIAQHLNIMGVPTFIIYKKGQMLWRQSGMLSATALTHVLEQAIAYKVEKEVLAAEA
jgi:thioredoxin 1